MRPGRWRERMRGQRDALTTGPSGTRRPRPSHASSPASRSDRSSARRSRADGKTTSLPMRRRPRCAVRSSPQWRRRIAGERAARRRRPADPEELVRRLAPYGCEVTGPPPALADFADWAASEEASRSHRQASARRSAHPPCTARDINRIVARQRLPLGAAGYVLAAGARIDAREVVGPTTRRWASVQARIKAGGTSRA